MSKRYAFVKKQVREDIPTHRPTLTKKELESVLDCLICEQLMEGSITQSFEKAFSSTFSYRHSLAVNSLHSAYHLAFLAEGLGPKDHVILSALSSEAAYDAASYLGAQIDILDISQGSFHPDCESVIAFARQLRKQEKESKIVYVAEHSFGSALLFDQEELEKEGIAVIEDITGVLGTMREEQKQGSSSAGFYAGAGARLALCGFAPYDLLTTGNGAMLVTSQKPLYKAMQGMRYRDAAGPKRHALSFDYRLGDFQAAMGINQLLHLGSTLNRRRQIAQLYLESLQKSPHESCFQDHRRDAYLRFPVIFQKESGEVMRYFRSLQIGISKALPIPLHHLQGSASLECANAERIFRRAFCIPLYPNLSAKQVERICSALRAFV